MEFKDHIQFLEMRSNKINSATGMLQNEDGLYLLVKPSYREGWLWPGGGVDPHEHPREACKREFLEEVGLEVEVKDLLQVSTVIFEYKARKFDLVVFLFEVECEDLSVLKVDGEEIVDYRWVTLEEAKEIMAGEWGKRLDALGGDMYFELD